MKSVTVHHLPVNFYLNKPVFLDEKYILLTPDIPITEELVNRLIQWDYSHIFSDGIPIENPIAVEKKKDESSVEKSSAVLEKNTKEEQQQKKTMEFFLSCCNFLSNTFSVYTGNNVFSLNSITEKVKEIIEFIKENRKYILRFSELTTTEHNQIVSQSVKTTIMALVLADMLKMPLFKQIEVGITGLLHDIGMIRIPPQIYMKSEALTPAEKKAIITHTILGFRILKGANFPMTVTRAVLEHQEKENGSGYPRGLTSERISLYAKIISIASSYVAILSSRPHREALNGHAGILDLLRNTGKQYDEQILKVLVYALSIYPIGTFVLLSNKTKGIVIETNPDNPKYPVVKLLLSAEGVHFKEQPVLNTREGEGGVSIIRPLTNTEIKEIHQLIH